MVKRTPYRVKGLLVVSDVAGDHLGYMVVVEEEGLWKS